MIQNRRPIIIKKGGIIKREKTGCSFGRTYVRTYDGKKVFVRIHVQKDRYYK